MNQTSFPPILTLEQAADYLQLARDELRLELETGRIPAVLIAGKWRISQKALDGLFMPHGEAKPATWYNEHIVSEVQPENQSIEPTAENSTSLESQALENGGNTPSTLSENVPRADKTSLMEITSREEDIDSTQSSMVKPDDENRTSELKTTPQAPEKHSPAPTSPLPTTPVPTPAPGRIQGRVFSYNREQRFGHARLADNRVVWLDSSRLQNPVLQPFPGDIVEFELCLTRKGLEARKIQIIPEAYKAAGAVVPDKTPIETGSQAETIHTPPRSTPLPKPDPVRPKKRATPQGTLQSQKLYEKAAIARVEGRIPEARRLFRQSIEAEAGTQVYEAFAKMEQERGNPADARQILRDGIKMFPDHPNFYIMLGHMERRNRNYREAERTFRQGIECFPTQHPLHMGLAQTLVQMGDTESLQEAGAIFELLERQRKLNKDDALYQRFKALQKNPRANKAYDFFRTSSMRISIAGRRDLPGSITDLVVELSHQEISEAFGLSGAFLVRCFQRSPGRAELEQVIQRLRDVGISGMTGLQDGGQVSIDPSLAFVATPSGDAIRDQIMSILGENQEAIIPLDDALLGNSQPVNALRDVLGQYLGLRDLYSSTMPVSGRRFFGREQLLSELTDQIQGGQFVGIYGLRKIGKTSLLYQLRDEKLRGEAVAYIDLQASAALATGTCGPLYWELERDLYMRLHKHNPASAELLRLGRYERFSDCPNDESQIALLFSEDIRAFLDYIKANEFNSIKRLVIILDELERILPIADQPGVKGYLEFFGLLRGLAQTERYRGLLSSVVGAANAAISERGYWEGRENPVFALYKPIFLPPLSEDECAKMIHTLGKSMSVYWEDEAIRATIAETGSHPFLTRLFCSHIIKQRPSRPLTVTAAIIKEHINPFIRSESDKLEQITELLRVNFPEEERFLEQIALGEITGAIPDESLRHLLNYQLIALDGGSMYHITLNLLHRWLRRRAGVRDE